MPEYRIVLPEPFPAQKQIIDSPARRKVVSAGRRFGKTLLAAEASVLEAMQGKRVLYATPTQSQSDTFWRYIKHWLHEPIRAGRFHKDENRRLVVMHPEEKPDVGMIQCRTAWDADTLRGGSADVLILDEFALMDVSAWNEVGAPMLAETDGVAWFLSTPRRRNHFYTLFMRAVRAKEQGDTRWDCWAFPSHLNPHLDRQALEGLRKDISEDAYRQEMLAEFLSDEGAVFRNLEHCLDAPTLASPHEHMGHYIVAGLDLGRADDYTAISIVCRDCSMEVGRDRFRHVDYKYQRQRLGELVSYWGVALLACEANAMGQVLLDEFSQDPLFKHCRLLPFWTTNKTKPALIDGLRLCFERELCQWQDDEIWTFELKSYEVNINPRTNHPTFEARAGLHDDTVIARALAWWAISQKRGVLIG